MRRFLSSTSLYAIGDLITKSARFILIPYYVHVLSKAEIGTLGVLQAVSIAAWTLFAFSCGFAVPRFYFEYKDRGDQFVATLWWARMGLTLGPCLLLIALSSIIAPSFMPQIPGDLIALSILSGFFRSGFNIIESWFVIRDQPVRYRTFTLLQFLTTTVLILYLVSVRGMGVRGVVLGEVASYSVWTLISGYLLARAGRPHFQAIAWPNILRFCSSLLPHTIFMWSIAYSDRVILQQFVSLKELGTYEFAYTMASILSVAALAMRAAWLPSFFRRAGHAGSRQEYAQTASYFFAVTFLVASGLAMFAPEAIWLISGGGYEEATFVMRIIVAGIVGFALFMALNQPLLYEGKTWRLSAASFTAMLINIGLNLWWIPEHGILGAAMSTLVTYLTLAAIAFVLTRHYYRTSHQREPLLVGGIAAVAVGWAGCALPDLPLALVFVIKLLLLGTLFIVLAALLWRLHQWQVRSSRVPRDEGDTEALPCIENITR